MLDIRQRCNYLINYRVLEEFDAKNPSPSQVQYSQKKLICVYYTYICILQEFDVGKSMNYFDSDISNSTKITRLFAK
jgi:hypothetical protein